MTVRIKNFAPDGFTGSYISGHIYTNPELARKACLIRRTRQAQVLRAELAHDRANCRYGTIMARQRRLSRIHARVAFLAGGGNPFDKRFCGI